MLDALGLEHLVHRMSRRGERRVDITTGILGGAQHVRRGLPHRERRARSERCHGVGDRRMDLIGDLHVLGRSSSLLTSVCHHDGEHVAGIRGATTHGDHHRPVLVDDADHQLTRHVCRGEHRTNAR